MDDIWTWAAIMLFLGPILAALAIPVFKWLFDDWRRIVLFALVLGVVYAGYQQRQSASHPVAAHTKKRNAR